MKNLVTIAGNPATKGAVVLEVTKQLSLALALLVINRAIVHATVKAIYSSRGTSVPKY